jgi:NhaP-type Na+/H+ or K+/H+ antiporter
MIFVTAGFIMGPAMLGWFPGEDPDPLLRVLADLTLALFLFIDAANANLSILRQRYAIPARMLLIGLPGAIVLGFILALAMFDALTVWEAAMLATMLAATDAALGKAVITNKAVPARLREGLNVESGLNDGLCVPILFLFIALELATGESAERGLGLTLLAEELGIGLLVGVGVTAAGARLLRICWRRGWVSDVWVQMTTVALALSCFAVAQSLHGSGYIAAFTGGMLFGYIARDETHRLVHAAEGIGETLALLTWMLFGIAVVGDVLDQLTWQVALYALLSLTLVRMLPNYLALAGSGESSASRLFLGWFGPRGLASIVFAIIVLQEGVPGAELIALVVACTVVLSLILHGVTAKPLSQWIAESERGA